MIVDVSQLARMVEDLHEKSWAGFAANEGTPLGLLYAGQTSAYETVLTLINPQWERK